MNSTKLHILFVFCLILAGAARGGPVYRPGVLTPENSAEYVASVSQSGHIPQGFDTELMALYLDLYPAITQDSLDMEGYVKLDPRLARDRERVFDWLVGNVGGEQARVLCARVLKFDPAKNVREKAAGELVRFKRLAPALYKIALDRMQHDLDAEVRTALIRSLGILYVDMDDQQASHFRMVLQVVAQNDLALPVMKAAEEALTCAREMSRGSN